MEGNGHFVSELANLHGYEIMDVHNITCGR